MRAGNLIFDLDGTLWDTSVTVAQSWTDTIQTSGIPMYKKRVFTAEDMMSVMGMTMIDIADKMFEDLSPTRRMEIMERCAEDENNYLAEHGGIIFDGEEETLKALSATKRLFIVSNCQSGYIETYLEYTGFEKYFSDYLCWGDTGMEKGDTIRALIEKNQCIDPVYVGDTHSDYSAAVRAEIPFIHAAYGFGKLRTSDTPAAVIHDLKELCTVIDP
ncbi:MAG: HAD family hydrolase [Oscillospiraceae bacterium]|nr:HAD family hydrolase [Oscillospiraceae bacterium]